MNLIAIYSLYMFLYAYVLQLCLSSIAGCRFGHIYCCLSPDSTRSILLGNLLKTRFLTSYEPLKVRSSVCQ